MTSAELKALNLTARVLFTDDFLAGRTQPDFTDHAGEAGLDRAVDLTALDELVRYVTSSASYEEKPENSDAWLAPRLHAALRLRRSEAADRRLWTWLAVVRYPDYVRWRWPGRDGVTATKRFAGGDRDNALSRLWWGAELTRNGGDYSATVDAFIRQDIPNTWFALDAFHNRAAAQAAIRMLRGMAGRPINRLSTALNHYLTTIMLDSVAPTPGPDLAAIDEWVDGEVDVSELLDDELPKGPDEDPVDEQLIDAVESLVRRVAEEIGIPLGTEGGGSAAPADE